MHVMPNSGFDLIKPPGGKLKNFNFRQVTDTTFGHVHASFSATVSPDSVRSYTMLVH